MKRIETGEWSTSKNINEEGGTGDRKVEEWVKRIQMNDPKVEKVWRSVSVGREKHKKPEQDATLAGAGEEDEVIKCFDDFTGKELPWQAVAGSTRKEADVSA